MKRRLLATGVALLTALGLVLSVGAAPALAAPKNGDAEWVWYCRTERFLTWTWQDCQYHLVYYFNGKWWF